MRFPKLSSTRGDGPKKTSTPNEFACTYYGWVMLPELNKIGQSASPVKDLKGDSSLGDTSVRELSPEAKYKRIVEMAKRVGMVQTRRKGPTKPKKERATASVSEDGICIMAKDHSVGEPLLNAATDTVICLLLSRREGVAVVVAHTWDSTGKVGIGCDVVKICNRRSAANFVKSFQNAVDLNNARREMTKAHDAMADGANNLDDANEDTWSRPVPRRRSTLADNTSGDGTGYMAVESFLTGHGARGSCDDGGDFSEGDDDLDVHYISVGPRASSVSSSSLDGHTHALGVYLSVSALPSITELESAGEAH